MGATGKLFKEIGYLIPDVDRRRVDRLARLLDGTEGMAIQGAAGSTGVIYVPGTPTGNPRYFKLSGETNAANSWGGAGYFQYSDNGSTLVTQIDDAGYIFNSAGTDIDFTVKSDDNANMFQIDGNLNVASFGGAVDSSYRLKVYGSTAIDKTYTAATAGEHIVKITATDSVTQTAGMLQTLLVDHNITGAKSGSAHSEGISVDMNIGSNINNAYASAVYISQSDNPNSSVIEGMNIYLEDMGSGTLSNILGLDIGINSTNVASSRHAGMRIRNHSGTATDAILIESAFGTVLNMAGATSTQDIKLSDGSIINDTNGFWGIGTGTPGQNLEIYADVPAIRLRDSGATADATAAFVEFGGTDAGDWVRTGYVGDATSATTDIFLKADVGGLQLGDSTASKIVYINGGTVTAYGAVMIDGAADAVQLTVQANAAQSAGVNIVTIEKSDGTDLAGFDERGVLFSDGGIDVASVYIGRNAGNTGHTNAIRNIGIGDDVLERVTTGDDNVFIGWGSGEDLTEGSDNTCVGAQAGLNLTKGNTNVAVGYKALDVATIASGNVAIGVNALGANTADENVAIGANALVGNTIGTQNMAVGLNAARDNTEGIGNMAIGTNALLTNVIGDYNSAIGTSVLASTTGDYNTAMGALAGNMLSSGENNIFIGYYAGFRQTTLSNLLIIDNQERADIATELTNSIIYGVMAAAPANQTLRVNADLYIGGSNMELRFYEGANYVGFEAPALGADQIWVLPTADGDVSQVLKTDGAGTLGWDDNASEKTWAFRSRSGASGTTYAGGFYNHSGTANDFSGGPTFGTANSSYAAHFFIVTGADTVDELTLTVTGTSIDDSGNYDNSPDTENIVIPNSTTAGAYYETVNKWLGQVTITVASGTAKTCDFGFCKYWDNNNTDYKITGSEATWLAGATDTAPNLILRHHKGTAGNTDWTYTGSGATPPTAITAMATDHTTTEDNLVNGENGAWKRDNLATVVSGSGSEGTIIEIVTTANKAFELGNFLLRIVPQ